MATPLQTMEFKTTPVNGHALLLRASLMTQDKAAGTSSFEIELYTVMTNYRHYVARTSSTLWSQVPGAAWVTLSSFANVQKTAARGNTRMIQKTQTYTHDASGGLTIDFEATLQTVDQRSSWAFKKQTVKGRFVANSSTQIRKGPLVNVNGVWKASQPWLMVDGRWRKTKAWVRHNGVWKKIGG